MFHPWSALGFDAARLGFEAQAVMLLRLARMATGSLAHGEPQRMVGEKMAALAEAQVAATFGLASGRNSSAVARQVVGIYRKRVRANRRRLTG